MNQSTFAKPLIKKSNLSLAFVVLALLAVLLASAQPVQGATFEVKNSNNNGPGSLRQAIDDANGSPGPDTIIFAALTDGSPIILAGAWGENANVTGDLDILGNGDLTIMGNGPAKTIIDGGGIDRVFHICPGGGCTETVTFINMTIRNGDTTHGGGVLNEGTLIVDNSTVSGSEAINGGGIANSGTLTVQGGSIIGGAGAGNKAFEYGGGIYNGDSGKTTVDSSVVSDNTALEGGGIYNDTGKMMVQRGSKITANTATNGGGIYNRDMLSVQRDCNIGWAGAGNVATNFGGGILNEAGTTTMNGSAVSANTAVRGGGFYNLAILEIENASAIGAAGQGNMADLGGGIFNNGGSASLYGSTISANEAFDGAGIYNEGSLKVEDGSLIGGIGSGNKAANYGGGIFNGAGTAAVVDSTVSANTAVDGGGIYNLDQLDVANGSLIGGTGAGNMATDNGGGIANRGVTTVYGSTVSVNEASRGGGIFNADTLVVQDGSLIGGTGAGNKARADGGGIYNSDNCAATINNSTVSANEANDRGGGIYNEGVLTVEDGSLIGGSGNKASNSGGGIYNQVDKTTVTDSVIMNNMAASNGGGVYNNLGKTTVTDSVIMNNTAAGDGGGVYNNIDIAAATSVTASCITGNSARSFFNNAPALQIATGNWWGKGSGPNTPGADTYAGNVNVGGFLTAPLPICKALHLAYLPVVKKE